jgi:hypothetical protein
MTHERTVWRPVAIEFLHDPSFDVPVVPAAVDLPDLALTESQVEYG